MIQSRFDQTFSLPGYWWFYAISVAAGFVLFILFILWFVGSDKEKDTYICPGCGENFKVKWYVIMTAPHADNTYLLKCPNCGKKALCNLLWRV